MAYFITIIIYYFAFTLSGVNHSVAVMVAMSVCAIEKQLFDIKNIMRDGKDAQ